MAEFRRFMDTLRRKILALFTGRCVFCHAPTKSASAVCEKCKKKLEPVGMSVVGRTYRRAFFCWYYAGIGKAILLRYKFTGRWMLYVDPLCDGLTKTYRERLSGEEFDAVVPVPAFGVKKTHLTPLVRRFCDDTGLSFQPEYLTKVKKTAHQRDLSAARRRTNLKNAFRSSPDVFGKRVLLIDDIFTTGSTAKECSETLLKGGAASVTVLTVFKTKSPE